MGLMTILFGQKEPKVSKADYDKVHNMYLSQCNTLKEARRESQDLASELITARRSNQVAVTNLTAAHFENDKLREEIAELRPDAEAHRARLSRDRDYHRMRRAVQRPATRSRPTLHALSEGVGG